MISKGCFEEEWIEKVCSTHKFRHPALVEKVIRAFSLLEMLVKEGCPLTFKGGTSLLLILGGNARRLSIDIDVLCPPGTDIEQYPRHITTGLRQASCSCSKSQKMQFLTSWLSIKNPAPDVNHLRGS